MLEKSWLVNNRILRPIVIGCLLLELCFFQACTTQKSSVQTFPKHLVVVELTASDCADCQEIHQILQNLKTRYDEKLTVITLDLSSSANKLYARETARQFHGEVFVKQHQDRPGTVAVLSALNGESLGMLENNRDEARYVEMFEGILAHASAEKP